MSQFHNAEPRTREERWAAHRREAVEQQMLQARRGGFHAPQQPCNPLVPEPTSPLYAAEANRFSRDVAGEIRQQKLEALRKQQESYDRKRQETVQREAERWQAMEVERQAEQERMRRLREAGVKSAANKGSEHYNIVTLSYLPTPEGQQLAYKDEVTRYRAVLRSQNLAFKAHSVGHNILTGQPRMQPVVLPPAPVAPGTLRSTRQQQGATAPPEADMPEHF